MTLQEKRRIWRNNWRKAHPDKWNECCRRYVSKNDKKISEYNKTDVRRKQRSQYRNNRRSVDVHFKLSGNLRSRLGESIKNGCKSGSAVKDLGCSIEEFKKYIENQWTPGMSWENYGRRGWHLDHIIPLASFDLTIEGQISKACHYTNYQPLWAAENIRKSNK